MRLSESRERLPVWGGVIPGNTGKSKYDVMRADKTMDPQYDLRAHVREETRLHFRASARRSRRRIGKRASAAERASSLMAATFSEEGRNGT